VDLYRVYVMLLKQHRELYFGHKALLEAETSVSLDIKHEFDFDDVDRPLHMNATMNLAHVNV
jgi:hypothetical protein